MTLLQRFATGALAALWVGIAASAWGQDRGRNPLLYELIERLDLLEQENKRLRGELELYQHRQAEQEQRFQELERRIAVMEAAQRSSAPADQYSESQSTSATSASPSGAEDPSASGLAAEQASYDAAIDELRNGRYDQAVAELRAFLSAYPTSRLAADAQYWLGEAYFVTRDLAKARDAFSNLSLKYPESDRMPDAFLKLGQILSELGDAGQAREILQQLIEAYPDSQAATLARKRLGAIR